MKSTNRPTEKRSIISGKTRTVQIPRLPERPNLVTLQAVAKQIQSWALAQMAQARSADPTAAKLWNQVERGLTVASAALRELHGMALARAAGRKDEDDAPDSDT